MTQYQLNPKSFIGIDVGKTELFVHIISNQEGKQSKHSRTFDNTPKGREDLILWISKSTLISQAIVCLEHTGCYGIHLIKELEKSPILALYVTNPFQIKSFAIQRLKRNKTDKADAKIIAQFIESEHQNLHQWSSVSQDKEQLKEVSRYAQGITESIAKLKTQLKQTYNAEVKTNLTIRIEHLEEQLTKMQQEMQRLIIKNEQLKEQQELIISISGLGAITTPQLIAELPELTDFKSAREVAARAGLTPQHCQSGTSGRKSTPISKTGNTRIRRMLYLPAMVAMKHNPILKNFAERLEGRGKQPKEIILAVARKLIHLIYGVLKTKTPFNPTYHAN